MSDIAIKFENISKQYRLGEIGTGTLSHDLNRWWYRVRGLEDPYLKIGDTNDRTCKGESDYVWALKDINFEVKQGEVLGIIGKNGAGKSTLLKILSKVTKPTTGVIKARGRSASLLEVGTGFHPEMTGRENIYMNGAIMGMTKAEITRKFDEIVDFAGVERYIDTPVKRYSSGMTVRLGFAIAAHLEPEILVVDEVLAVGDAEFQKKAVGKMQDVSRNEGRTVLFVSHNMSAIKNLCSSGLILSQGHLYLRQCIEKCVEEYLNLGKAYHNRREINDGTVRKGNGLAKFTKFNIYLDTDKSIVINLAYEAEKPKFNGRIYINIIDIHENSVIFLDSAVIKNIPQEFPQKGEITIRLTNSIMLKTGSYPVNIALLLNGEWTDHIENASVLEYNQYDFFDTGRNVYHQSIFLPAQEWIIN